MFRYSLTCCVLTLSTTLAVAEEPYKPRNPFEARINRAVEATIIPIVEFRVAPGFELFAIWGADKDLDMKELPTEILKELRSKDPLNRHAAVSYLAHLALVVRTCAWLRDRDDSDAPFRLALGQFVKPVTAALESVLKEGSTEDRALAAATLLALVPDHTKATDTIVDEIHADDAARRQKACELVGNIRLAQPKIVTALAGNIGDAKVEVLRAAAQAVWKIGPKAAAAVPALIELLKSGDAAYDEIVPFAEIARPERQNVALLALAEMGADARSAVPVIVGRLDGANPEREMELLGCLAALGANAREALPDLRKHLSDEKGYQRYLVAAAILRIDSTDTRALEVLLGGLKSADKRSQNDALNACAWFGPRVKALVPLLIESLKDDYCYQEFFPLVLSERRLCNWECAVHALEMIGQVAELAVPALMRMLIFGSYKANGGHDYRYQEEAAYALGAIGVPNILALAKGMRATNSDGHVSGTFARGRTGKEAAVAIPTLKKALSSEEPWCRCWAAVAAGRLKCVEVKEALIRAREWKSDAKDDALRAESEVFAWMMAAWALTQIEH
jgi:hypothetical protein